MVLVLIMEIGVVVGTKEFWRWFLANQERLHGSVYDDDALLDEVEEALHLVDARLAFEIGRPSRYENL